MPGRHPLIRTALIVAAVALVLPVLAGCGDSGGAASACGPTHREALDPNFPLHVLPGATDVHYRTDPPTSGAHQPAPRLARVQRRPLPRPVQVGLLEAGDVLVQYRGLSGPDVVRLRRLAGGHVVVAPYPTMSHRARVVATAWIFKRTCSAVDIGAIEEFVQQRAGHGPGTP